MLDTIPDCPNLQVPRNILEAIVRVESGHNPFAIGVVGNRLARQPKNKEEAVATVKHLESRGFNYSIGIAQVNRSNFVKYGINSADLAFDVCANLEAGSKILQECYSRSNADWGKAFSCYYSGNFVTGYRHGYVQKVKKAYNAAHASKNAIPMAGAHSPSSMIAKRITGSVTGISDIVEHEDSVQKIGKLAQNTSANSASNTVRIREYKSLEPIKVTIKGGGKTTESENSDSKDSAHVF